MQDALGMVAALRRPKLLIRAARHGQTDYRRAVHLPRILSGGRLPKSGEAVLLLLEREADLNAARLEGRAGYTLPQHVEVLIALMGEAHLLRTAHQAPLYAIT